MKLSRKTASWIWTFTFGILLSVLLIIPFGILYGLAMFIETVFSTIWDYIMLFMRNLMRWYYKVTTGNGGDVVY